MKSKPDSWEKEFERRYHYDKDDVIEELQHDSLKQFIKQELVRERAEGKLEGMGKIRFKVVVAKQSKKCT